MSREEGISALLLEDSGERWNEEASVWKERAYASKGEEKWIDWGKLS